MFDSFGESRLAACLFGDVAGFGHLLDLDEAGTLAALSAHRHELVGPAIAVYNGRLLASRGDVMIVAFGSAVDAVSCAVSIQRKMIGRTAGVPHERRITFRLGIGFGEIVGETDSLEGEGVNLAGGLRMLCDPGGICVSGGIEEQIRGRLRFPFVEAGEQSLETVDYPVGVFRLPAEIIGTLPETALPSSRKRAVTPPSRVGPGAVFNDTYQIDEVIGSGGMGEIFRGHEIHSGGVVAIKVIRPDMMHNDTALQLFQKEALVLKDINHDAIVRYFSFSFDQTLGRHYLAMEFVDGPTLSSLLKQGPLSFEAVAALCTRVASGLQMAHERGVVHRDLSPDNIIFPMGQIARAKIIDFGIARTADIGGATILGGGFAGKYNYVSPEQLGLAGGEVTARSDIYCFGLVLAEACLGRPLDMDGSPADVIEKRRQVPDLAAIDPRLRPLLDQMLQPAPPDRPDSMAAVAAWLADPFAVQRTAAPEGWQPLAQAPLRPDPKPPRPLGRWIVGGALALALLWGGALTAYLRLQSPVAVAVGNPDVRHEPETHDVPNDKLSLPPIDHGAGPKSTETGDADRPKMASFLAAYRDSECFYVRPIKLTPTSAAIDGFGLSKEAFAKLDQAFTRSFGFSPDIVGNRVWSRQCPVLDFMRQLALNGTAPKLFLKSARIGGGGSLAGEVQAYGDQVVTLLEVREDGSVLNVSDALKPDGGVESFDLAIAHETSGPTPQVLVAIASPRPLDALNIASPMGASSVFPALLDEAKTGGISLGADAKVFLFGG